MPQDGNQCFEESFNSFLAGVLLTRNSINNFDFFILMNNFEKIYNVDIVSAENEICVPIYFDDNKIKLHNCLDDIIYFNGKKTIVRDYLYSVTSPRVREFFKIPELKNITEKKFVYLENKAKSLIKVLCKNKNKVAI